MRGGVEINFCLMRGEVRLDFEPYFIHFPTPPHPGNYCTVPNSFDILDNVLKNYVNGDSIVIIFSRPHRVALS